MTWEWKSVKDRIHELYITQNMSLDDVIRIIKDERGFEAKKRTYQKKLQKWGFSKKASRNPRPTPSAEAPRAQVIGFDLEGRSDTHVSLSDRNDNEVQPSILHSFTYTSSFPGPSTHSTRDIDFEFNIPELADTMNCVISDHEILDLNSSYLPNDQPTDVGVNIASVSRAEENCTEIATNLFRDLDILCPETGLIKDLIIELRLHSPAIETAIAYIAFHEVSIPDYIVLYHETLGQSIQRLGESVDYGGENHTQFTTAEISIQKLSDKHRHFLLLCSFLDGEKIPLDLLCRLLNSSQTAINECITELFRYKLIFLGPCSDISIRPEIQRWLWKRLSPHERLSAGREAIMKMSNSIFLDCTSSKEDWEFAELATPHIGAIMDLILRNDDAEPFWNENLLKATARIADVARRLQINKVILVLEHICHLMERILGCQHPYTLDTLNSLSVTYISTKNWAKAEPLLRTLVISRRNSMDRNEFGYLTELINLMRVLIKRGHVEEAKELHITVSDSAKKAAPRSHSERMRVEMKLGESFRLCGYLTEAEGHFLRLHRETESILGKSHPSTLRILEFLCHVHFDRKSWGHAKRLGLELVKLSEAALGKEQTDTVRRIGFLERVSKQHELRV